MKLVSWNVNGLRACIQKGFLDEFEKFNADFFCLQETKLSEGQLELDLPGYHQYWCYAQKKGYSGTAIFARHEPQSVQYGIGVEELDREGRVITLEYPEFFLVTCYTPNAQRELARIDHRMKWDDAFRSFLQRLDAQKPVILCGDLNVAHKEIDLKNPASNRGNAGFSDQERESFQKTLDLGFTDTFRHLHPDKTGAYSWWSYMFHAREKNAGWRIDYFLVSDRIRDDLYRAEIHSDILGSDHCPVSIDIDLLVNGGIFTHETTGKPRVVEAEPTNKSTKSSAVTAKDFVSILPIVMVLCLAISLLGGHLRSSPTTLPTETTASQLPLDFEIKIYSDPFTTTKRSGDVYTNAPNETLPDGSRIYGCFDNTGTLFYLTQPFPAGNFNTFLRITDTTPALNYNSDSWEFSLVPVISHEEYDEFGAPVNALCTIPYYDQNDWESPAGWLLWASLPYAADFRLDIRHSEVESPYTTTLSIIPYLDRFACAELTTADLLQYIVHHPDVNDTLHRLYNIPYNNTPDGFTLLRKRNTALDVFLKRDDAIGVLMSVPTDENSFVNNLLLSISYVRNLMTAEEELQYLTTNYATCNWSYDFSHSGADPEKIMIDYVFEDILDSPTHLLTRCLYEENIPYLYEFLREKVPALSALEKRENAVSALMETLIFKYKNHYQYGPIYKIPSILLSLPIYQSKMTPYEEAQYITGLYGTSPEPPVKTIISDLDRITTANLYNRLYTKTNSIAKLQRASSDITLIHVFQIECNYNPLLKEFFQREDAETVIINKSDYILSEIYYKIKTLAVHLSDKQLVDLLIGNTELMNEYLSNQFSHYGLFVMGQIANRPGAVSLLMNMDPLDDEQLRSVPHAFLKINYDILTPLQKAQFICRTYRSCHLEPLHGPSVPEKDLSGWTTNKLFNSLQIDRAALVNALSTGSTLQVQIEVYNILRESSNLLQELENRPAETYELICNNAGTAGSQMRDLKNVWKYLFSDHLQ